MRKSFVLLFFCLLFMPSMVKGDEFTNYIVRYWQFATNRFHPVRNKFGKYFNLGVDSIDEIRETILSEKCKSVCLNDSPHCSDEDYVSQKVELHKIFELKYPSKSSFEL